MLEPGLPFVHLLHNPRPTTSPPVRQYAAQVCAARGAQPRDAAHPLLRRAPRQALPRPQGGQRLASPSRAASGLPLNGAHCNKWQGRLCLHCTEHLLSDAWLTDPEPHNTRTQPSSPPCMSAFLLMKSTAAGRTPPPHPTRPPHPPTAGPLCGDEQRVPHRPGPAPQVRPQGLHPRPHGGAARGAHLCAAAPRWGYNLGPYHRRGALLRPSPGARSGCVPAAQSSRRVARVSCAPPAGLHAPFCVHASSVLH